MNNQLLEDIEHLKEYYQVKAQDISDILHVDHAITGQRLARFVGNRMIYNEVVSKLDSIIKTHRSK